jgi:RecB family exonuclease
MTLRVFAGRANTGKTGMAYREIRRAADSGSRATLVLPTAPDVEHALRELAQDTPMGISVVTFDGAVRGLWDSAGDGRSLMTESRRSLALAGIARSRGHSTQVARLAAECARHLSEQIGQQWRLSAPTAVPQAGLGLADILVAYAEHLANAGLVEPAEAMHLLARSDTLPGDLIVFHRFTDFSAAQLALIRGFSAAGDTIVTLTWEAGFQPTTSLDELVGRLEATAVETSGPEIFHTHGPLETAASLLFAGPAGCETTDAVRLVLAEGHHAEARCIAQEVRMALSDGSASAPEAVAVAFRDLAAHRLAIERALEEADLHFDYDAPTPLVEVPFGAAFVDAISFVAGGGRSRLCSVLRSRFSDVPNHVAITLEHLWRASGRAPAADLIADLRRHSEPMYQTLRSLMPMAGRTLDLDDFEALAGAARYLFSAGYGRDVAPIGDEAEADGRAHARITGILSEAAACEVGVLLEDVLDALKRGQVTPARVERKGRVQIVPVTRLRGRRFDTVVLGGLNAGEFPAAPQETMLPSGAVGGVLRSFGGFDAEPKGQAFEQLLFYEAVTRARNRVVLSAQTTDADGGALRVSPLFEAVADLFRPEGEYTEAMIHRARRMAEVPDEGPDATRRERLRAQAMRTSLDEPRVSAAVARARVRPGLLEAEPSGGWPGDGPYSASQIQAYLRCPYRWFYEYAVRPRELERSYDARDEGEFAHALLARVYQGLIADRAVPLTPRGIEDALQRLEELYLEECVQRGPHRSFEEALGRRRGLAWARRILAEDAEDESGFAPAFIEHPFGTDGSTVDIGGIPLRGRIDRIDVDSSGCVLVVDYKRSCSARHGADKLLLEGLVQIPLYLEAARLCLGVTPVAGLYRSLSERCERGLVLAGSLDPSRTTRTDVKAADEFERIHASALALAREAVERMQARRIEPRPLNAQVCASCPVADSCGARL